MIPKTETSIPKMLVLEVGKEGLCSQPYFEGQSHIWFLDKQLVALDNHSPMWHLPYVKGQGYCPAGLGK